MSSGFSRFNWTSLILGIVALIAAIFAFRDPAANLLALTALFGVAALFRGLVQIYGKFVVKGIPGFNGSFLLIIGIINVIFGILLLSNLWAGMMVLSVLFAIWFTVESILSLITSGAAKLISTGYYWLRIIFSIIGILIGISLFMHPISAGFTLSFLVGLYFLFIAINCFIEAFNSRV
ncbi:MAG: DUF308 domain-containing protein [Parabacteroides sp.]|nr:DUF308 domain-containing protein [Parabacteroides sp.]